MATDAAAGRGAAPRGLLLAAFAAIYLIWGSTYLAIRIGLETMPPFLMAGARFLIAGTVLLVWARSRGIPMPTRAQWRSAFILGGLFLLIGNGGVVWAEQRVPSGLAALLVAMLPVWTVIIEWVQPGGQRPSLGIVAGLATGFAGLAILVAPTEGGVAVDPLGAGALLLASFSWAVAGVRSKRMALPASPPMSSGIQMLAGGTLLVIVGALFGDFGRLDLAGMSTRSLAAVGYLIVFGSLVGFSAFAWLLQVTTPSRVATYAYVNPVVAVLLGWALAGERLGMREIVAAVVIIAAVGLITTARARTSPRITQSPAATDRREVALAPGVPAAERDGTAKRGAAKRGAA